MPLSVPVDTNPIVKEPPVFSDGDAIPSSTIQSTLDYSSVLSGADGIAYNESDDEFYLIDGGVGTGDQSTIYVQDGFGTTTKRTLTTSINCRLAKAAYNSNDGFLYAVEPGNVTSLFKVDVSDGTTVELTGYNNQEGGIAIFNGNLYRLDVGSDRVDVHDGITTTVNSTIDVSTNSPGPKSIAFVADNMVIMSQTGFGDNIFSVYSGVTTTLLRQFDFADTIRQDIANVSGDLVTNIPSTDDVNRLKSTDSGQSFTGNSGKILESGKIYSFEIIGPNAVTNPTINDDGQGAKTIVLPGGASIPVGALTGNFDFLYNGSNYVVVSLTEALAEAIYNFEPGVLDNLTATSDPTVNDDTDAGYAPRSRWFNTSSSESFMCLDASAGAAVWVKTSLTLDELGSAAVEDVGTAIGDVVQLEDVGGNAGMPAVDGSQLTGINTNSAQVAQAWVNFNGSGTVAIRDQFNVSSITDNATGDYTINFTTALADTSYAVVGTTGALASAVAPRVLRVLSDFVAVGSVRIRTELSTDGAQIDVPIASASIFGGN